MKRLRIASLFIAASVLASISYFASCTHKDTVPTPKPAIERGSAVVSINGGGWVWDKSHSNVMWETPYDGVGAMLTGRFNQFGINTMQFYEGQPDKIQFDGWVRLNTVNTGEPGRDTGCLLKTFNTTKKMVDQDSNIAKIKTKKVEFSTEDTSYIVTFDLTFNGVTKELTGKLTYSGNTRFGINELGTNTKPVNISGLTFEFELLCKTDFKIVSTSVADKVNIRINTQYKYTES